MSKQRILVLTGAGISAESGLKTFRDGDGLWENHRIEDVASIEGWLKDPEKVLQFYNQRRRDCLAAMPNQAHIGLVSLERQYELMIVTQNIDDLHERAGSSNVIHLHGLITKMRSELNEDHLYPYNNDIVLGAIAADGTQWRPHVVWFGEPVPNIDLAVPLVREWADIIVLIGSSLLVYPAAGLLQYAPDDIPKYVIDKRIPDVRNLKCLTKIEQSATEGIKTLIDILMS